MLNLTPQWSCFVFALSLLASCGAVEPSQNRSERKLTLLGIESQLASSVRSYGGKSATGPDHPIVCKVAQKHAQWMASHRDVSHYNSNSRKEALFAKSDANRKSFGEIVASGATTEDCAKGWRDSPGHWKNMKRTWDAYCYTAERGSDGLLYCIGLFMDGLSTPKVKIPERKVPRARPRTTSIGTPVRQPKGKTARTRRSLE